jgi:bifunctional DNA-binding transcriptional regulator/antitoxin component of YhaV-PrlF toxin-antitoxin module
LNYGFIARIQKERRIVIPLELFKHLKLREHQTIEVVLKKKK